MKIKKSIKKPKGLNVDLRSLFGITKISNKLNHKPEIRKILSGSSK